MLREKVLIVDDEDINIDLLKNTLSDIYDIYVAKDGFNCINIMKSVKPSIVLLDVLMPIRDGFKTLEIIKENPEISDIPVIFITALKEVYNVTRGFELGAEDYITKPFNPIEIKLRVKIHLELNNSKKEIKELLIKTLGGSVNMLMEVLAVSNPVAFSISNRIKDLVRKMGYKMHISDMWKLELAGMLSLIGCHPIPTLALEKIILGQKVSSEEHNLFEEYPENGAKLVEKIPRLEDVAKLIRNQNVFMGDIVIDKNDVQLMESIILNHATHLELLRAQGLQGEIALHIMMGEKDKYNKKMLELIGEILLEEKQYKTRVINLSILEVGMVLGRDLINKDGKIIVKKDVAISDFLKDHLIGLSKIKEIEPQIYIKVK